MQGISDPDDMKRVLPEVVPVCVRSLLEVDEELRGLLERLEQRRREELQELLTDESVDV